MFIFQRNEFIVEIQLRIVNPWRYTWHFLFNFNKHLTKILIIHNEIQIGGLFIYRIYMLNICQLFPIIHCISCLSLVSPSTLCFTAWSTSSIKIGRDLFFTWKLVRSTVFSVFDCDVSFGIIREASDKRDDREDESKEPYN